MAERDNPGNPHSSVAKNVKSRGQIDTEDAGTNAAHTRAAEIGVIELRAQRLTVRKSLNSLREKPQNVKLNVPSYSPGKYFHVIAGKYSM